MCFQDLMSMNSAFKLVRLSNELKQLVDKFTV